MQRHGLGVTRQSADVGQLVVKPNFRFHPLALAVAVHRLDVVPHVPEERMFEIQSANPRHVIATEQQAMRQASGIRPSHRPNCEATGEERAGGRSCEELYQLSSGQGSDLAV